MRAHRATHPDVTIAPAYLAENPRWVMDHPYAYTVTLAGQILGYVYRVDHDGGRFWAFRNDDRGIFGTVSTRHAAIDALVSVAHA